MEKRRLGQTDMYVNMVGLGCMGLSHASGTPVAREEAIHILQEAHHIGYDLYDTAECYTGIYPDGSISYNEEIVGEAIKNFRNEIVLCTKFGVTHKGDHLELDSSPQKIRESIEGSLKKLQTNYIDIYYQHRIDPQVEPEIVAGVMKELIQEGKIKAWGISEVKTRDLVWAHAICPVTVIQNRYSMMARWHEHLINVCQELGITYIAFSPLANGALTGAYHSQADFKDDKQDFRRNMPQYSETGMIKTNQLLKIVSELAKKYNATNAQISLAWMLSKFDNLIPIPGSRKIDRLASNFAAGNIHLSYEDIEIIDYQLEHMEFEVFGGH